MGRDRVARSSAGKLEVPWSRKSAKVIPGMREVLLMATTMTTKGQVTVPKVVRDYLGLKGGRAP